MKPVMLLITCLAVIAAAGCGASAQTGTFSVSVNSEAVPLDITHPTKTRVGALIYAGGFQLTSPAKEFGGFSGLDVMPDGQFVSQTDVGKLMSGRIVLDQRGKLAGLADTVLSTLTDTSGKPYTAKLDGDAEDITYLPGGGFAVSFEQDHRVQVYPGTGPVRRLARPPGSMEIPNPDGTFPPNFSPNRGLEGLTVWTDGQGRTRLVEGGEDGRAWSCDLEGLDCAMFLDQARDGPEKDFSLTGLDALPDGRSLVATYRAFDLLHGNRSLIAWIRPDGPRKVTVLARLSAPYTVDNFEGIAALPNPDGSIRLYLISDNNFNAIQRTLLLAFDWRGPARTR